jgi:hypothetical protein
MLQDGGSDAAAHLPCLAQRIALFDEAVIDAVQPWLNQLPLSFLLISAIIRALARETRDLESRYRP